MNNITVIGNIVQDLAMKQTENSRYCRFRVAVQRKRDKNKTDFFTVTVWGKPADILMTYAGKGDKCMFSGEMHADEYTDSNGNKRTSYEIVANEFEFLSTKKKEQTAVAQNAPTAPAETIAPDMDNLEMDLPFEI